MYGSSLAIVAQTGLVRLSMVGVTALTLMVSGPVNAADLSVPFRGPPPVLIPIYTWTGFYVGGQVGYSWGRDHLYEYVTATNAYTNFEKLYTASGIVGGVYGGGNYQFGQFVLGLEGDIEGSSVKGGWNDVLVGGAGDTRLGWQGSVRGRLGYAVDKALFYGTGGVAFGDVSHTYGNLLTGINETTSGLRTGWTAGAGVEIALTQNVLARVEYRYTDFGQSRYDSVTSFPGLTGTQELRLNTIRVGAAYKF